MIRSKLVHALAEQNPAFSARDIDLFVSDFFSEIAPRLAEGGWVDLRGFGVFSTRERIAGAGHNPRNGVAVEVPAKPATHFRVGRELCALVNKA